MQAESLAHRGAIKEALEICWDLRGNPGISLYVRACVNQLIGSIISVKQHPDAIKFPQEVITLLDKLKVEHPEEYEDDVEALNEMRELAQKNAHAIADQLEQLRIAAAADEGLVDLLPKAALAIEHGAPEGVFGMNRFMSIASCPKSTAGPTEYENKANDSNQIAGDTNVGEEALAIKDAKKHDTQLPIPPASEL